MRRGHLVGSLGAGTKLHNVQELPLSLGMVGHAMTIPHNAGCLQNAEHWHPSQQYGTNMRE